MHTTLFGRSFRLSLVLLALLLHAATAAAATVIASPRSAAAGADFLATADGLTRGVHYRFYLHDESAFGQRHLLGEFDAAETTVARRLRVPRTVPARIHALELVRVDPRSEVLEASTAFGISPSLAIAFDPPAAEPGRKVTISISGLHAGNLSVSYAGETVLGPVAVGDGTHLTSFVVPRDRPATIPSTVDVVATNSVGRSVVGSGAAGFDVLAPSGLPRFRSSFTDPPPPSIIEGTRLDFAGTLLRRDDSGTEGRTSFFWRSDDGLHVIPIDGGVVTEADGSYTLRRARSPSWFMDGSSGFGDGRIITAIRDRDPDTGTPRDSGVDTGQDLVFEQAPPDTLAHFTLRLRGVDGDGTVHPLEGVYVQILGPVDAFAHIDNGVPPIDDGDMFMFQSQFAQAFEDLGDSYPLVPGLGCEINFANKFTDANGEARFTFDPEELRDALLMQTITDMGEIRIPSHGAPIPDVDVFGAGEEIFGKALDPGQSVSFSVRFAAGQTGYGETGLVTEDGTPCQGYNCSEPMVPGY